MRKQRRVLKFDTLLLKFPISFKNDVRTLRAQRAQQKISKRYEKYVLLLLKMKIQEEFHH